MNFKTANHPPPMILKLMSWDLYHTIIPKTDKKKEKIMKKPVSLGSFKYKLTLFWQFWTLPLLTCCCHFTQTPPPYIFQCLLGHSNISWHTIFWNTPLLTGGWPFGQIPNPPPLHLTVSFPQFFLKLCLD